MVSFFGESLDDSNRSRLLLDFLLYLQLQVTSSRLQLEAECEACLHACLELPVQPLLAELAASRSVQAAEGDEVTVEGERQLGDRTRLSVFEVGADGRPFVDEAGDGTDDWFGD